jgi:hypothetical protein
MIYRTSGFDVELPESALDATSYTFLFPELGELPPSLTISREVATGLELSQRRADVHRMLRESLPHAVCRGQTGVKSRGNSWSYFTHTYEYGEEARRIAYKQVYLRVGGQRPLLYIFSGTDLLDNFRRFEPCFDAVLRSFRPASDSSDPQDGAAYSAR